MFTLLKLRELRMMGIRSSGKDRSGKPAVGSLWVAGLGADSLATAQKTITWSESGYKTSSIKRSCAKISSINIHKKESFALPNANFAGNRI